MNLNLTPLLTRDPKRVPCPVCGAKEGEPCVSKSGPGYICGPRVRDSMLRGAKLIDFLISKP